MKSRLSRLERRLRACVVWNFTGSSPNLFANYYDYQFPQRSSALGDEHRKERLTTRRESIFKHLKNTDLVCKHDFYMKK